MKDYICEIRDSNECVNTSNTISISKESMKDDPSLNALTELDHFNEIASHIEKNIQIIQNLKEEALQSVSQERDNAIGAELSKIIEQTDKDILHLKKITENIRHLKCCSDSNTLKDATDRIILNVNAKIMKKIKQLLLDYRNGQAEYSNAVKEKIVRRIKIVLPDTTDEKANELFNKGCNDIMGLVRSQVLNDIPTELTNSFSDLNYKYQDVKMLENHLQEMKMMFDDIQLLIDYNENLIQKIDVSVMIAEEYIKKGDKQLVEAHIKTKQGKKKMYWITGILIGIGCIVAFGIVYGISK